MKKTKAMRMTLTITLRFAAGAAVLLWANPGVADSCDPVRKADDANSKADRRAIKMDMISAGKAESIEFFSCAGPRISRRRKKSWVQTRKKGNTSMRNDEQAFKVVMAVVMIAALGFSSRWAMAAETVDEVKDCGGKRVEGTVSQSSGQVERTSDCFEQAFSNCEKATWLFDMEDAVVIQYSIEGKDTASGKCVGGYKYLKHFAPHLIDQHIHCKLDRSITPFLQSFAMAAAGTSEQRRATCEGPIFEAQEKFFEGK